jgi:hypothetical protein
LDDDENALLLLPLEEVVVETSFRNEFRRPRKNDVVVDVAMPLLLLENCALLEAEKLFVKVATPRCFRCDCSSCCADDDAAKRRCVFVPMCLITSSTTTLFPPRVTGVLLLENNDDLGEEKEEDKREDQE